MPNPARVLIVGAGRIAAAHAEAILASPGATLVGVVDADPVAAERFGQAWGVPHHSDLRAGLAQSRPALAVVCAPPCTHEELTIALLEAGVAVLCEKPFALGAESARRMLATADNSGVVVTMASKFRFVDDVTALRSFIASGELGEPLLLQNVFAAPVDMAGRWNADRAVGGGGVLIDTATHSVDIVRYVLGPISEVLTIGLPRVQPLEVEDSAKLLARTARGVLADIDVSWTLDRRLDGFLWIQGSEAEVQVGWRSSIKRRTGGDWVEFGKGYDKVAAMSAQITELCEVLRGGSELRIDVADALSSVQVLDAAYASLADGGWVPVATRETIRS